MALFGLNVLHSAALHLPTTIIIYIRYLRFLRLKRHYAPFILRFSFNLRRGKSYSYSAIKKSVIVDRQPRSTTWQPLASIEYGKGCRVKYLKFFCIPLYVVI